ncbi:MarR family winged helix-turn-helix transcriptional regulator [Sphingobium sp. CAP-1]|uniref:MarR family winged helix-turn-helix transcriptional regulator n=1 Tax=Sphingobium sp. CAP-1 TaxID=2676077 RepID=UPI001E47EFF8|nr:MarR family transcriptional regulator [Sphingobium sp. CAP-1]
MPDRKPVDLLPDPRLSGIDGLVGFHIRLASAAVYQHFTETFSDLGLTQKQVAILWLIEDQPGIAQADIGRRLRMDRASVMAIVNRMQDRGFLKRGASAHDRRRQTLSLTDAGAVELRKARASIAAHEAWLKARFTAEETASLMALLRRIYV